MSVKKCFVRIAVREGVTRFKGCIREGDFDNFRIQRWEKKGN